MWLSRGADAHDDNYTRSSHENAGSFQAIAAVRAGVLYDPEGRRRRLLRRTGNEHGTAPSCSSGRTTGARGSVETNTGFR